MIADVSVTSWSKLGRRHACAFQHRRITSYLLRHAPEANLGMFSMFDRTGAPTKRRPHKRTKNCQSAAAAIVVRIAARVLNKMSMTTTVRVGPDSEGSPGGRGIHILGAPYFFFFLNMGPAWSNPALTPSLVRYADRLCLDVEGGTRDVAQCGRRACVDHR